ncbi:MAG: GxxExxY protein [Chloroflexota bacterium]|nr:GxxExxY protein [Chloroflexota bacterium]
MTEHEKSSDGKPISYKIIGAAIEVHRMLGAGLLESVYEDALCIELDLQNIKYERQKLIELEYKGRRISNLVPDLIVENSVIVELKSVQTLEQIHTAQVLTYLKLTNLRTGLLINFNVTVLKDGIKRIVL